MSRRVRDNEDAEKLFKRLDTQKPFIGRDKIISISTRLVGAGANCYSAYAIEMDIMNENEKKRWLISNFKRPKK